MSRSFCITALFSFFLVLIGCAESEPTDLDSPTYGYSGKDKMNLHFLADINSVRLSYDRLYDRTLTLWDLPYKEMDLNTTYGNAHVIVTGPEDGKPMVLLHGMNATSTMWYPNIKAFSENHRVYAIDFILEPNKSELDETIVTTFQLIDWYFEIFDLLELNKFDLVGASRGGWLSTKIALRDASRIDKLVLLSPAQTFKWIPPSKEILSNLLFTASPKREDLREVLATLSANVDHIDQLFIDQFYETTDASSISPLFIEMTPIANMNLRTISIPVLVMIGDQDMINPRSTLSEVERIMQNGTGFMIKDAGHFLSIDQPKEVNKRVLDFLAE